jgi:hypothetical protein
MKSQIQKKNIIVTKNGFIALMSVLIIGLTLLGITFSSSTDGFFSRFSTLDSENKRISLGLAESCVNTALLKIAQDYNYQTTSDPGYNFTKGGVVVPVGNNECIIKTITYGAEDANHQKVATISTQAQFQGTWSNMKISATVQNPGFALVVRGTITVITHIINDNGGVKSAGDFTLQASPSGLSPSPATFSGSESGVVVYVNPGAYSITESSDSTYNQSSTSGCSGTVLAGQNTICTFTENDIPTTATLTLIANVKNDNGGTKQPSDFPLYFDGISAHSGVPITGILAGTHTASGNTIGGYTASTWGYHCASNGSITLSAGDKKTCIITFDDNAPPAPICAETVMMLDRTGSMGGPGSQVGTDLYNEKAAANALVNLYAGVLPSPKLGVGIFGDGTDDNGLAPAQVVGQLTTNYTGLTNTINTWLANSSGYTNLSDAISKADAELNSVRHDSSKQKVMIVVSDGDTNRPNGSISSSTPLKFPTANSGNALPTDSWNNGAGVYGTGGSFDNAGFRHRYYNFNFGTSTNIGLPSNSVPAGIELSITASSTTFVNTNTIFTDDFGTGGTSMTVTGWTENGNGGERRAPTASGNDSASPNGGRFAVIYDNSSICTQINATGQSNLKISYNWRGDSDANSTNDQGILEYRIGGNCNSTTGWTSLQTHDLRIWNTWSAVNNLALPALLNNTTFFIRYRTVSNTNEYFRVDGITFTGSTNSTCNLGVDLSWNGGNTWTAEKTVTLSNTLTTYTLGGTTNLWNSTNWSTTSFSNTNFRARVHSINAGPTCSIDSLQAKAYYTIPVDPIISALQAADSAKLSGTQVFTIFFGNGNPNLLAQLASGSTPNAPYQSGSANDKSSTPISGNTGYLSPTTTSLPNQWSSASNGFISDNSYATTTVHLNSQGYSGFSVPVPNGATVTGIEVIPEAKSSDSSGCQIGANISWDNGSTWTAQKTANLTGTDSSYTLGASNDTWGHAWKNYELYNNAFIVKLQNIDPGTSCTNNSMTYLDQVRVRVSYTSIPENTDNDNFFVSPTSADMQGIFEAIGAKVCPAIAVAPTPPPTTATLYIITHVINDDGGLKQSSDFTSLLSAINPYPIGTPAGSYTGQDSPGVVLTVDPGSYSVDQTSLSGYTKDLGVGCSGILTAGDTKTCTITDNDIPPSNPPIITPPPLTNITISSWQEATTSP